MAEPTLHQQLLRAIELDDEDNHGGFRCSSIGALRAVVELHAPVEVNVWATRGVVRQAVVCHGCSSSRGVSRWDLTVELVNLVCHDVIGDGRSRAGDVNEFVDAIHDIQRMIMSQAAARAYPDRYRLLGWSVGEPERVEGAWRG